MPTPRRRNGPSHACTHCSAASTVEAGTFSSRSCRHAAPPCQPPEEHRHRSWRPTPSAGRFPDRLYHRSRLPGRRSGRKSLPHQALLSFGANPILTQPDSKRTAKALSKLEFYVHVDLFHNPSNEYADVLLPSSSLYENDSVRLGWELTVEGAERLQYRPQLVSRRGDTRSDAEIAFLLARALGYHDDEYFALDLDAARDRVLEPLGITLAELKEKLVAKILPTPATRSTARTDSTHHHGGPSCTPSVSTRPDKTPSHTSQPRLLPPMVCLTCSPA